MMVTYPCTHVWSRLHIRSTLGLYFCCLQGRLWSSNRSMSQADIDLGPHAGEFVFLNSILNLSATVILFYDYALTLDQEIQFLWPPHNRQSWFTFGCLLNRYLPLLGHVPPDFDRGKLCRGLHIYHENFAIILQLLTGILSIVRIYALYARSFRLLVLLVMIGSGGIFNAVVMIAAGRRSGGEIIEVISSIHGCNQFTPYIGGRFAALAWTGLLVWDSVIFSFTLYKAFTIGRGIPLLDVIVRDGAMYFFVLFTVNLGNILVLWLSPPLMKTSTEALTNVLSVTLVSRFVLNLREQSSALIHLPTAVETEDRFQAALPPVGPISSRLNTTCLVMSNVSASH
ncbi:hypothetical protein BGW80DRAFT_1565002 [Lactifluus volemus]|nr:hypothetical protein BGW80DRAFT_1565002 [Lactifluus volemus]